MVLILVQKANPAEWMLQVVGAPGSHAKQDYFEVWRNSSEYQAVREEINRMEAELSKLPRDNDPEALLKYAAPLWKQYLLVSWRTIVQDWRSPGYIYSKLILVISSSLFIGFSFFKSKNNLQGLQSQMLAVFMFSFHSRHLLIKCYYFVKHRAVYEVSSIKNIQLVCIYCWSNHFRNSLSNSCWYHFIFLLVLSSWIICQC